MKEIIIERNLFDFDRFVGNTYTFINEAYGIDPACLVQNIKNPCMTDKEACAKLQKRSSKDLLKELENGEQLFLPFSQALVSTESDHIKSVDGTQYEIKNNLENLFEEYDTIGFIISIEDSKFIFKYGIHKITTQSGVPRPIEEINEINNNDYEQFFKPMDAFLNSLKMD
jgi:hypothetical protein